MPGVLDSDSCPSLVFTAEVGSIFGLNARTVRQKLFESLGVSVTWFGFGVTVLTNPIGFRGFGNGIFGFIICSIRSNFWFGKIGRYSLFDAFDGGYLCHVGNYIQI